MTIEERIEYLQQSIESHDRQLAELVDRAAETDKKIAQLGEYQARTAAELTAMGERMVQGFDRVDRMLNQAFERVDRGFERVDQGFERVQLNLDRLTTAMLGLTDHVADHARRIDKLEQ